jgi:hypothetical protein
MNLLRFAGSWAIWALLTAISWGSLLARSDAMRFEDALQPVLAAYDRLIETVFSGMLNWPPLPGWTINSAEAYETGLAAVIIAPVLLTSRRSRGENGSERPDLDLITLITRPLFLALILGGVVYFGFTSGLDYQSLQDRWLGAGFLILMANAAWHPDGERLSGLLLASKNLAGAAIILLGLVFAGAAELIA